MVRFELLLPLYYNDGRAIEREKFLHTEYLHFLHIAKGSAAELRTQVYIAQCIGLFPGSHASELVTECKEISAMLHGLITSLRLQS